MKFLKKIREGQINNPLDHSKKDPRLMALAWGLLKKFIKIDFFHLVGSSTGEFKAIKDLTLIDLKYFNKIEIFLSKIRII